MFSKHYLVRGLLVIIAIYHLACGILANTSQEGLVWVGNRLAGASITPDNPQLFDIARPFGVYLFCFGLLMGLAAIKPVKYRGVITVAVILFLVRAAQRLIFAQQSEAHFNIPHWRNLINVGIVAAFAVILLILRIRLHLEIRKNGLPAEERQAV